jgi:predicted dehydrogenase
LNESKIIKIGIIGCSSIGETRVLPALLNVNGLKLWRVGSRDLTKAAKFAGQFKAPKFGSYTDVINDVEIEAIYISLPPTIQEEWSLIALLAGKHVLSEKPGALSARQAHKIIETARLMNRVYLEGYMFQFHPQFLEAKRILDSNEIGKPKLISCTLSYPRQSKLNFRENVELGGGVLNDSVGYSIMATLLIFNQAPKDISFSIFRPSINTIIERVGLIINFDDGMISSSLIGTGLQFHSELRVLGAEGSLTIQRAFSKDVKEKSSLQISHNYDRHELYFPPCDHFVEMWCEFYKAILGDNSKTATWSKNFLRLNSILDQMRTENSASTNLKIT